MPQSHSAPIRARDLRANIKQYGFERGVVITLELLLDEWAGMRQQMQEMASIQSATIDQLQIMVGNAEGIARRVSTLQQRDQNYDEHRGIGIIPDGNG